MTKYHEWSTENEYFDAIVIEQTAKIYAHSKKNRANDQRIEIIRIFTPQNR